MGRQPSEIHCPEKVMSFRDGRAVEEPVVHWQLGCCRGTQVPQRYAVRNNIRFSWEWIFLKADGF